MNLIVHIALLWCFAICSLCISPYEKALKAKGDSISSLPIDRTELVMLFDLSPQSGNSQPKSEFDHCFGGDSKEQWTLEDGFTLTAYSDESVKQTESNKSEYKEWAKDAPERGRRSGFWMEFTKPSKFQKVLIAKGSKGVFFSHTEEYSKPNK